MLWVRIGVCCCFLCEGSLVRGCLPHALVLSRGAVEVYEILREWLA